MTADSGEHGNLELIQTFLWHPHTTASAITKHVVFMFNIRSALGHAVTEILLHVILGKTIIITLEQQ